jgi:hypothetical protein
MVSQLGKDNGIIKLGMLSQIIDGDYNSKNSNINQIIIDTASR